MGRGNASIQQAKEEFAQRGSILRTRLADPDFLANRALGNEVGIHIFCYDPALELDAEALFDSLERESASGELPCNLKVRNLYDVLLEICEEKRVLDAIPRMEAKRGTDALVDQLTKTASAEEFARALAYEPHEPGDVLLITGAGAVYPILRIHALLDNIQHLFPDIPIVVAYPGKYNGQSLCLFAGIESRGLDPVNYYRAFSLV